MPNESINTEDLQGLVDVLSSMEQEAVNLTEAVRRMKKPLETKIAQFTKAWGLLAQLIRPETTTEKHTGNKPPNSFKNPVPLESSIEGGDVGGGKGEQNNTEHERSEKPGNNSTEITSISNNLDKEDCDIDGKTKRSEMTISVFKPDEERRFEQIKNDLIQKGTVWSKSEEACVRASLNKLVEDKKLECRKIDATHKVWWIKKTT